DTVRNEQTGLVVPVDDPPALAAAIVRLLGDGDLRDRLGQAGRAWMIERFTLARSVADLEGVLSRSPGRAEDHYRMRRTIARAARTPFRVFPVWEEWRRVAGQPPLLRSLIGRVCRALGIRRKVVG